MEIMFHKPWILKPCKNTNDERIARPAPVDGAFVGADQLFLFFQKPDGCLKWEDCTAAAAWGRDHFDTLLQCLRPLVLPQSRPAAQLDRQHHIRRQSTSAISPARLCNDTLQQGWLHEAMLSLEVCKCNSAAVDTSGMHES